MSRSYKRHPAGPIGGVKAGSGRKAKRARSQRERQAVRLALRVGEWDLLSHDQYPTATWDIGDGKTWYGWVDPTNDLAVAIFKKRMKK